MREITLEELLEAGCHFGHQVNRNNPKANEFIFEARNNVHIINLEQTRAGLIEAAEFIKNLGAQGGTIIVVGTKRQVQPVVKEEVTRARENGAENVHYVASRWIGGILTNFLEVSKNFKKLNEIEEILASKNSGYTKREKLLMEREKNKLMSLYEGVRNLKKIPDALFIVDTHHEATAVHEAGRKNVTVVGMVDTNGDPTVVNYAIPSNDDAVGAVKAVTSYIMDAWLEGQKKAADAVEKAKVKAEDDTINVVKDNTEKDKLKKEVKTEPAKPSTASSDAKATENKKAKDGKEEKSKVEKKVTSKKESK
jgi:small subunit ribosomal protein S2